MTSPNGAVPDKAYVSGGSGQSGLSDLNDLTEGVAKQRMRNATAPSFNAHRDGVWANNRSILDVILGRYTGDIPAFVDGQLELNERIDLLGKFGYCSAYLSGDYRTTDTGPWGVVKDRAIPFNSQIGPRQDAEIVTVNRSHPGYSGTRDEYVIRLDRAGLWQVSAMLTTTSTNLTSSDSSVYVLRPDYTVYSITTQPLLQMGQNNRLGVSLQKSVVVPEPGYFVQVRIAQPLAAITSYRVFGGARYSQFTVTQWSDDYMNAGQDEPGAEIVE